MTEMAEPDLPNAPGAHDASAPRRGHERRRATARAVAPILALMAVEALAIRFLAPPVPGEATPAALAIALLVLLVGITPALLRPSAATSIVGCSAVVLASVLWRASDLVGAIPSLDAIGPALDTGAGRLSLLNTVLIAPLTLHLTTIFPRRGVIGMPVVVGFYALIVGAALASFALPPAARPWGLGLLLAAAYAGFGLSGYQLLQTARSARTTSPRAAQQARLLLLALFLAEAPAMLLPLGASARLLIPYELLLGAQILLPLGVAYAIIRNDLFGVDAALRRTLDYTLVSFGLLVIYFSLAALLTQLSRGLGGGWGLAATVLSVIAAAAAFTPLHRVTQRVVDRAFYPERLRFSEMVAAARARLARVVRREEIAELLEAELPPALDASWARLVLRPSFEQPATEPGAWSALLTVAGRTIGGYWLGPRRSGLGYAPHEQEQLQSLAQQAALALAYAETYDALARLNRDLEEQVATRTEHVLAQQRELAAFEERQRLARDLHDSVKQTLFSLGIGLRAARQRVPGDPERALALLEQQEQAALQAQAELGELLGHLRTPATGTADLVMLLERQIARLAEQHGIVVERAMPPSLVLPEPLPRELARIAGEALHNVLRHSGGIAARVTLRAEHGELCMTVEDDGRGFDPSAAHRGQGLRSMGERAAIVGGSLEVRSTPGGGTTIHVRAPLKP
jgi:signal transduction histidine kinase